MDEKKQFQGTKPYTGPGIATEKSVTPDNKDSEPSIDGEEDSRGNEGVVNNDVPEANNSGDEKDSSWTEAEDWTEPSDDDEDDDLPAVKWTQKLDPFWKKIIDNVTNSVSWRKIINLIRVMVSMGQRWVIVCNQAFESEISLDRWHTIGYNDKVEPAIAYIEKNKKTIKFSDDKFYKFTKVKDILEEYFFNLWNIKL